MGQSDAPGQGRGAVGLAVEDLDTPALLLDLPAAERNLRRMADFFRGRKAQLRPHFKNHKCPALALRQLAAGSAVGMTCAKLGEAEVLARHGVADILVANQVVGRAKLRRLVDLARRIDLKVAVDDAAHVEAMSQAAQGAQVTVGVLVEVNIGMDRCGVAPGEPALGLARLVARSPGLRFAGLQAYEGHAVYENDALRREQAVRDSMALALETRRLIERDGIAVAVLSGGSSSTYQIAGQIEGVDEIQAGTYATMDWRYAEMVHEFEIALSVLARVISKRPGAAVLDVGLKGMGSDFGPPRVKHWPDAQIPSFRSEEHCVVRPAPEWRVGDAVELVPSHACTTCNLHRVMYACENGRVVDAWPIEASGRLT